MVEFACSCVGFLFLHLDLFVFVFVKKQHTGRRKFAAMCRLFSNIHQVTQQIQ